jgi:hypothetical protein
MENPEITLKLTLDKVNAILQSLGQGPFVQVADLIGEIRTQASGQLPASEASAPTSGE